MFDKIFQEPTGNVEREMEPGIAVDNLEKRSVTAQVCIGQDFGEIPDGLMSMYAEQQRDRLGHKTILRKSIASGAETLFLVWHGKLAISR
jgi:hypothetical protein